MAKPPSRLSLTMFGMRGMLVIIAGLGAVFAAWRYHQENLDPDRSMLTQRRRQLGDPDPNVRLQAARALGDTRQGLARPAARALVPALFDPDAPVREAAANSLEHLFRPWFMDAEIEIDAPEAGEALIRRLDDPEPAVRSAALRALARVVEGLNNRAAQAAVQGEEAPKIDFDSSRAVPGVLPLIDDPDPAVREAAVSALVQVHPDPAAARRWLLAAFRDERVPKVRHQIFHELTLSRIASPNDPAIAQWLVATLDDSDPDIRLYVPQELDKVKTFPDDTRAILIERLQRAFDAPQIPDYARFRIACNLRRITDDPGPIRPFLRNPDPWIRSMARSALGLPNEEGPE